MLREVQPGIWIDMFMTRFVGVGELNYYFIPGAEGARSLLVDCGLPDTIGPECRDVLLNDLKELKIDPETLDCIITHSHRDHVGQAATLNALGARVFLNPADMRFREEEMNHSFMHPELKKKLYRYFGLELSNEAVYQKLWETGNSFIAGFEDAWKFSWEPLEPGAEVSYGAYRFSVVPLPGHTRGHMGLWDREHKILFSGDQLVHGVTPLVADTGTYPEALEDYFNSMRDIKHRYADCLLLPGHGEPFRNPEEEADRAVNSYLNKCTAMYDVVRRAKAPLCIRGVATRTYGRYGKTVTDQERRSCILMWVKTLACLEYMRGRELVKEEVRDGISYWSV